jgi:hypothetical protein
VLEIRRHDGAGRWVLERSHRLDNLRAEGHESVAVEHRVVGLRRLPEVSFGELSDQQQLVLYDLDALLK